MSGERKRKVSAKDEVEATESYVAVEATEGDDYAIGCCGGGQCE